MPRKSWSDNNHIASAILERLMPLMKDTGGIDVTLQSRFDLLSLAALWDGAVATPAEMLKALSRMKTTGAEPTVKAFEIARRAIDGERAKRANQSQSNWLLVVPLYIKLPDGFEKDVTFRILGERFTLKRFSTAFCGAKRLKELTVTHRMIDTKPEVFEASLHTNAQGSSHLEAWAAVDPAYDALRGLFELVINYRSEEWFMAPFYDARVAIQWSPWALGWQRDSRVLDSGLFPGHRPIDTTQKPLAIGASVLSVIQKYAASIPATSSESSASEIVADALRLYAQAMDAERPATRFLGLWQVAESVTLAPDARGSGTVILPRLRQFMKRWSMATDAVDAILDRFYFLRNEIAHRGIHDRAKLEDVNFLKRCCEGALLWLLKNIGTLKSKQHLEHFYQTVWTVGAKTCFIADCSAHREKDTCGRSFTSRVNRTYGKPSVPLSDYMQSP